MQITRIRRLGVRVPLSALTTSAGQGPVIECATTPCRVPRGPPSHNFLPSAKRSCGAWPARPGLRALVQGFERADERVVQRQRPLAVRDLGSSTSVSCLAAGR